LRKTGWLARRNKKNRPPARIMLVMQFVTMNVGAYELIPSDSEQFRLPRLIPSPGPAWAEQTPKGFLP
jgi:hypothetical protein